jgi:hypothetical protein
MSFKSNIKKYISNIPGWRTTRKIVVFESDDWGSIRMPSIQCYENLEKAGIPVGNIHFNKFDSLENNSDMESLFDVLTSFKDCNGNHPIFTPYCVVANPDFDKIKSSNFKTYYYEPVTETLKHYRDSDKVIDYWKMGVEKRIFVPQFHGREHLNVLRWMHDLECKNEHTLLAFENRTWGISSQLIQKPYQAAMDFDEMKDLIFLQSVIEDGLTLFEKLLGYRSTCYVPANGTVNLKLSETLIQNDIRFLMLNRIQKEPLGNGQYQSRINTIGNFTKNGLLIIPRNAVFEPSSSNVDWVNQCLKDIEIAFRMKKPAIISSHRVNYIGSLNIENRNKNLLLLKQLIVKISKKWPDVVFMSSDELGQYMLLNS